ncbi:MULTISPECIES: hypothetical protein [Bacillus]|uniref:hypothetical protein n=1 Tax=Bacillus TaxID=1386 RepID=UPI000BB7EA1A|nr:MULTISPECIES: hypothetical protein [Bacillus]
MGLNGQDLMRISKALENSYNRLKEEFSNETDAMKVLEGAKNQYRSALKYASSRTEIKVRN